MNLSDDTVAAITAVVIPALVALARVFLKDRADKHAAAVEWAVGVAYNVTNEVAKHTTNKVDDKVAFALGVFRDALRARGIESTPAEETVAKLAWKAHHGVEKELEARALAVRGVQGPSVSPQMPPA